MGDMAIRWCKRLLADSLGNLETAKQLMFFFAATHDIGKTSVIFQSKPSYPLKTPIDDYLIERLVLVGLDMPNYEEQINAKNSPHAFAGEVMLQIRGCPRSIGATIGSHHGMPSDFGDYNADNYYSSYGEHYFGRPENRQAWQRYKMSFFNLPWSKLDIPKLLIFLVFHKKHKYFTRACL